MLNAFTLFLTAAGAFGSVICAIAVIVPVWRKWKLPEPPLKPSCLIFTTVEMQRPEGLPGHSRPPRDRLL
ncbi:MAG: hypothetical protein ABL931_00155 [Usitatibacteraceae bacterium]